MEPHRPWHEQPQLQHHACQVGNLSHIVCIHYHRNQPQQCGDGVHSCILEEETCHSTTLSRYNVPIASTSKWPAALHPDPDVHACVNVLVQIPQEFTSFTDNAVYLAIIHIGNKTAIISTAGKELNNLK